MDELKRCPFCGSIAIVDEVKSVSWRGGKCRQITKYIAQCIIPGCIGHHKRAYISEQKAIDKWNMRTGDPWEAERMAKFREIVESAISNSRN